MASMPGSWDASERPASGSGQAHPFDQQDAQTYQTSKILSRRNEYLRTKTITIKIGSWNTGNFSCWEDVKEWFTDKEYEECYGMYALSLQEVVDVNQPSNFLKDINPAIAMRWKAHVQAALPSGYQCVASPQLIGMLLLVFMAPELAVGSVSTATVGTGLMGYVGNKGAVGARIVLGDTLRLTFIDCHLAAYANAVDRRNWDAAEVVRRMWFGPVEKDVVGLAETNTPPAAPAGEGLDKTDVMVWCGDLNYRIDLDNLDVRSLLQPYMPYDLPPTHDGVSSPVVAQPPKFPLTPIEAYPSAATTLQGTIKSLLKHDQLLKQKREGKAFAGYKEGNVTFLPTYKYDVGTVGSWDSSEKARAPSWCDRILWRLKEPPATGEKKDLETGGDEKRHSAASSRDEVFTEAEDEILFETTDNSDSDEEDLIVSRAESPLPQVRPPTTDRPASPVFDDPTSSFETPFGEVKLEQMSYTSHQNITSSDHKPISATFQLEFPAIVPDLRAKIHGEVAREVDKLENERRPVVTMIIDHPGGPPSDGEDVINFGPVRFWERKRRNVTIANTGTSKAKIHFVGLPSADSSEGGPICKPWISLEWLDSKAKHKAELEPGEIINISITLLVSTVNQVLNLNNKLEVLDDVLVLRVDGGRDVFIPISGKWLYSSYGTTLKELIRIPEGIGGFRGYREAEEKQKSKEGPVYSAPREIYRITQFLCDGLADVVSTLGPEETIAEKRWFSQLGWPFLKETWMPIDDERRRMIEVGVYEALDTDRDFDDPECVRVVMSDDEEEVSKEELVETAAGAFLRWLEGLNDGVVPETFWDEIVKAGGDTKASEQVLDHLPEKAGQVHANVFIYLVGFVAEILAILVKKKEGNKKKEMERILGKILEPVARALVRKLQKAAGGKVGTREEEARKAWVRRLWKCRCVCV
ncbi:Endonuclease/exonuclease/phosphatase [Trichophaea hybrida]|nr:Endonuclease/exonuclease/phosphatase [Trichophaea hybrida]